jgi:hypothetical protein
MNEHRAITAISLAATFVAMLLPGVARGARPTPTPTPTPAPVLTLPAATLTADFDEGVDPMRQITTQFVNSNVMIVMDNSGSLGFAVTYISGKDDYIYDSNNNVHMFWTFNCDQCSTSYSSYANEVADWSISYTGTFTGTDDNNVSCSRTSPCSLYPQSGAGHGYWLRAGTSGSNSIWYFVPPSRMAILKNSLGSGSTDASGNSNPQGNPYAITIYAPKAGITVTTKTDSDGKTEYTFAGAGPVNGDYFDWPSKTWKNADGTSWSVSDDSEPVPDATYTTSTGPGGLIQRNAKYINWGLVTYYSGNRCAANADVRQSVIPRDSQQDNVVKNLNCYFGAVNPGSSCPAYSWSGSSWTNTTISHGLNASGGTPTRAGLDAAVGASGSGGLRDTYTNDTLAVACRRTYAALLVTDGQSNCGNTGNPADSEWDDCSTTASDWTDYPPDKAYDLWNNPFGVTPAFPVRTYVVGVSQDVGGCELNWTAYEGHTDANAPAGDAGFNYASDPNLAGTHPTSSETYYFAANDQQTFSDAWAAIVSSVGEGDYSTSPPATAYVTTTTGVTKLTGFVASTSYPAWEGHLYAYDLTFDCTQTGADCTGVTRHCGDPLTNCLWDAGEVLTTGAVDFTTGGNTRYGPNNGQARHVYTWDSSHNLVEITSSASTALWNLMKASSACSALTQAQTSAVADFVLGNDGSGTNTPRPWKLGAMMNSTPALVGPPEVWKQNLLQSHGAFASGYISRHPLVWAGSSDGMMHAFDSVDGAEIVALLPPDMLCTQAYLYNQWKDAALRGRPDDRPTGEAKGPDQHIYGVANSPRIADVWFPATGSGSNTIPASYKTVLFLTEGWGGVTRGGNPTEPTNGNGLHAIDITHPYPGRTPAGTTVAYGADPNYDSTAPVAPIWDRSAPAGVYTWSVPALAASSDTDWQLLVGRGFDSTTLSTSGAVNGTAYRLDPTTGLLRDSSSNTSNTQNTYTLSGRTGAWVHNQGFADEALWCLTAPSYAPDNLVSTSATDTGARGPGQGVVVDLNGQIWTVDPTSSPAWQRGSTPLVTLSSPDPIYFTPAVATYGDYDLYAFGTGDYYERSSAVSGSNVGASGNFIPSLDIFTKEMPGKGTNTCLASEALESIPAVDSNGAATGGTLGPHTQLTAGPFIFTPALGSTGDPFALFLLYDPDSSGTCVGTSYVALVQFNPSTCNATLSVPATSVYYAGLGAGSGFAIAGSHVVVAKSYIGQQGRAYLIEVKGLTVVPPPPQAVIEWWLELQ